MNRDDFWRAHIWYPALADYTFMTSFVKLKKEEIEALAQGETKGKIVNGIIDRMRRPMDANMANWFVSVDTAAPTDTERFASKRGAVHSPESAWRFLAESYKIRQAAADGNVEYICIRPFRRMNKTREFRLFIYEGELIAMSQYWLIRHFRRMEGVKQEYWNKTVEFFNNIKWALPAETMVMDIYCTSDDNILIVDLNKWGECDPKLLHRWDRDWTKQIGIVMMAPPTMISGDVNVSF